MNLVNAPGRNTPYQQAGILNFVFGHVWQRPGLSRRDRRFITVACVGVAEAPMPILSHVGSAPTFRGPFPAQMDELILQFSAYSGAARGDVLKKAVDNDLLARGRSPLNPTPARYRSVRTRRLANDSPRSVACRTRCGPSPLIRWRYRGELLPRISKSNYDGEDRWTIWMARSQ